MAGIVRGGLKSLMIDGVVIDVAEDVTIGLGTPEVEELVGQDRVHGIREMPRAPYIECSLRDRSDLDMIELLTRRNATVIAELRNGKSVVLSGAAIAGDGTLATGDSALAVRMIGTSIQVLQA